MYKWFDLLLKNVITLFFIKPNENFKENNKTIEFEYEKQKWKMKIDLIQLTFLNRRIENKGEKFLE